MTDFDADSYIKDHAQAPSAKSDFDIEGYISDHGPNASNPISGETVYRTPIGPNPKLSLETAKHAASDVLKQTPTGSRTFIPENREVVEGSAPLAVPAAIIPKFASLATKVAESAPGRLATSYGSGFVTGAASGPSEQSFGERLDRGLEGGKTAVSIQGGLEALPYVGKALKFAGKKAASAFTGETEKVIKTYADKTDEINQMIKDSGGDMTEAADAARAKVSKGIQSFKANLNGKISSALGSAPKEATISTEGIIGQLEKAKNGLNKTFHSDAISEIDDMIAKINAESQGGKVNAESLNVIKQGLYDGAAPSYSKGGQIFARGTQAQRAFKSAGAQARKTLNEVAPEIADANNQLSALHSIESNLNKNLITAGKADGALFAAGSGSNNRNAKMLKRLGDISGVDALGAAEDLAAARAFSSPSWMPTGSTGKTVGRMMLGAGTGYLIDGEKGAAIGAGLTSPAMLKVGINVGNALSPGARMAGNVLSAAKNNPAISQAAIGKFRSQVRENNPPRRVEPQKMEESQPTLGDSPEEPKKPKKGEDRWADRGAKNLGLPEDVAARALQSKEGKRLLIEASDLPAGSKKLESILNQISKGWGNQYGNEPGTGTEAEILRHERRSPSSR